MIENPNQLDKFVLSMTDDEDTIIYIRMDNTDNKTKGLINGTDEDLTDALFTMCTTNQDFRNLLHNVICLVEQYEAENN